MHIRLYIIVHRKPEEVNKQVGDSQYTPLHYAMLYVNVECVILLVGANAGKVIPLILSVSDVDRIPSWEEAGMNDFYILRHDYNW